MIEKQTMKEQASTKENTENQDLLKLAHVVLETFPIFMSYVSCSLRRKSPIENQVHFHVLRLLRKTERSMHELAELSSVRLPTMSRTVDALEGHNRVERFRKEGDRRTVYVRICPEGEKDLAETESIALERASELLSDLSIRKRSQLLEGLNPLHETLLKLRIDESSKAANE